MKQLIILLGVFPVAIIGCSHTIQNPPMLQDQAELIRSNWDNLKMGMSSEAENWKTVVCVQIIERSEHLYLPGFSPRQALLRNGRNYGWCYFAQIEIEQGDSRKSGSLKWSPQPVFWGLLPEVVISKTCSSIRHFKQKYSYRLFFEAPPLKVGSIPP